MSSSSPQNLCDRLCQAGTFVEQASNDAIEEYTPIWMTPRVRCSRRRCLPMRLDPCLSLPASWTGILESIGSAAMSAQGRELGRFKRDIESRLDRLHRYNLRERALNISPPALGIATQTPNSKRMMASAVPPSEWSSPTSASRDYSDDHKVVLGGRNQLGRGQTRRGSHPPPAYMLIDWRVGIGKFAQKHFWSHFKPSVNARFIEIHGDIELTFQVSCSERRDLALKNTRSKGIVSKVRC